MSAAPSHDVTGLLQAWCKGDEQALAKLVPLVYEDLHRAARRHMAKENSGNSLETTALINEVYLRLVNSKEVNWQNRTHFLAICSRLMRRILIDFARSRSCLKRDGGIQEILSDEAAFGGRSRSFDLLALDEAMDRLAVFDQRKSQVVEMRFFGGLTAEETAQALNVSVETVLRDWRLSKVWLFRELASEKRDGA